MASFQRKTVRIEAIQWTGDNFEEALMFILGTGSIRKTAEGPQVIIIETAKGQSAASPGDWIVKGADGEIVTSKAEAFDKTYELAAEAAVQPESKAAEVGLAQSQPQAKAIKRPASRK